MMKRLFTLAMATLMVLGLSAQDEKTVVCIGQFQNNSNKSSIISKNLRNEIMDGIIEKDRLTVVDITTLGDLPKEKNELVKMLNEKGIEFIIEGTLNSVDVKKDDKYYKSEINYTLTIIDTSTGITKNTCL